MREESFADVVNIEGGYGERKETVHLLGCIRSECR